MKVFKATDSDMSCHLGKGKFQYHLGVPATGESSKCGDTGLHACEYVLDCVTYYRMDGNSRFFEAEATGDIAEDGVNTRISCTELTLTRELCNKDIAREVIRYIVQHPKREGWQHRSSMAVVETDSAGISVRDGIAIARGENPRVKGCAGAHVGWIRETEKGITEARLMTVGGVLEPGTWYTIEEAEEAIRRAKDEADADT